MVARKLYIALRLMRSGSIRDVMRYKFVDGIDEEAARCVLKQALEGLKCVCFSESALQRLPAGVRLS